MDAGHTDAGWYVPTAFEVAGGWVHGQVPVPSATADWPEESPAAALRAVLREEILQGPCVVPFSGGRDSSLVLAVACSVAREVGATLPTALTFRHPGIPESDESAWQELVMAHLGGLGLQPGWRIRDIDDELDIVGPLMAPLLEQCGHSVWPPNMATMIAVAGEYPSTAILSGEYGDGVLGARRATVIAGLLRRRGRGLSASYWRAAGQVVLPRVVVAGGTYLGGWRPPWLSPRGRRQWRALAAADALRDPFRYDRNLWQTLSWRGPLLGMANLSAVCRRYGCTLASPLAHPRVLSALARSGGWRGPQSRGYATRLLGADLLPDQLYGRDTKANCLDSRFNQHTIATVDAWKGQNIDPDWVDAGRLASAWRGRQFHPQMAGLVQSAWLAQRGLA